LKERVQINNQIRAQQLRVIGASGANAGVVSLQDALAMAKEAGLDLILISPNSTPPVAKIMDYGKFQYEQKKKARSVRAKSRTTETKNIQVKISTGEHDLALKAKKASKWLKEGNRIKVDLFLPGRSKYMERSFLEERLRRILHLITEDYHIAEPVKKSPKGLTMIIERTGKTQK
jgi:translation initiation factor IF-3